jgi:hypothetical protein
MKLALQKRMAYFISYESYKSYVLFRKNAFFKMRFYEIGRRICRIRRKWKSKPSLSSVQKNNYEFRNLRNFQVLEYSTGISLYS